MAAKKIIDKYGLKSKIYIAQVKQFFLSLHHVVGAI